MYTQAGNTTAKITSQHGLFYDYLLQSQGTEKAKQYLEANEEAIKNIENIIKEENIDCDFEREDNYVYTLKQEDVLKIKKEVEAVNSLGFPAKFVPKVDLPFEVLGAIKFPNQAQFNPCKYVNGLVKSIIETGNTRIYENTKVVDLKANDADIEENKQNGQNVKETESETSYKVITENGNVVTAKYVVLATHYPIINIPGYYFLKMYQEMSYIIGVETKAPLFEGMYINTEKPTISFRTATINKNETNSKLLLIGGMTHKTGEEKDLSNIYENLEAIAKHYYPDSKVIYRWCTEDCISLDKIPYIGEFSNLMPNVYVGTGYKKWGMTTSNVAANIITDKILGKENPYQEVFTSTRLKPIKNREEMGNMIKEVVKSFAIEKLKVPEERLHDIKEGTGGIIELDDKKIGVYKDNNGKIYAVKPVCTHLGCELTWNNLENTWDCPCHGSRFTYEGKSIYDPSIKDLETYEIENKSIKEEE